LSKGEQRLADTSLLGAHLSLTPTAHQRTALQANRFFAPWCADIFELAPIRASRSDSVIWLANVSNDFARIFSSPPRRKITWVEI